MNKEFEEETSQTDEDAQAPDVSGVMPPIMTPTVAQTTMIGPMTNPALNNSSALSTPATATTPSGKTTSTPAIATPSPTATPSPSPSPKPTATATPAPSPVASPSPGVKEDKLNKGDSLTSQEAKRKVTIEAKADVWVRYRSDDRPVNAIILRKGRFLVIKAKDKLLFETNHPESVRVKTGRQYGPLDSGKVNVTDSGVEAREGTELGSTPLPDEAPARPGE